jgi:hypothetical protein
LKKRRERQIILEDVSISYGYCGYLRWVLKHSFEAFQLEGLYIFGGMG